MTGEVTSPTTGDQLDLEILKAIAAIAPVAPMPVAVLGGYLAS